MVVYERIQNDHNRTAIIDEDQEHAFVYLFISALLRFRSNVASVADLASSEEEKEVDDDECVSFDTQCLYIYRCGHCLCV